MQLTCDGEHCGNCPACASEERILTLVPKDKLKKLAEATFAKILPSTYKSSSFGRERKARGVKAIYNALKAVNERKVE